MSRTLVALRRAELEDAAFLADLWADGLRRADPQDHLLDLEQVIKTASTSAEQRLVVAEYEAQRAGAVLLLLAPLTPLNLETTVHVIAPQVATQFRRHGIGRQLMESAAAFAEENGVAHLATGVAPGARDANRFMARLTLTPHATFRMAPVAAVRARLNAQRPAMPSTTRAGRQRTRVLAARRSMRRSHSG